MALRRSWRVVPSRQRRARLAFFVAVFL